MEHEPQSHLTLQNDILARRNKDDVVGIVVMLWAVWFKVPVPVFRCCSLQKSSWNGHFWSDTCA